LSWYSKTHYSTVDIPQGENHNKTALQTYSCEHTCTCSIS